MTTMKPYLLAASAMLTIGLATTAFAQQPPGFSPLDRTNQGSSGQDGNLRPHPTPPLATAVDKLPLDKIKLPAGFKAELWSSGHPAARTMVVGAKGTIGGLRGKVYRFKGAKLIVTYHPAACLRNPAYKRPVWEDMQLLAREYLTD